MDWAFEVVTDMSRSALTINKPESVIMNPQTHSIWMSRFLGLGSLSLMLSLVACDAEDDPVDASLEDAAPTLVPVEFVAPAVGGESDDTDDEDANVITEIVLAEQASIRFIDESVGGEEASVGMLVIGVPGLLAAARELELTPLEVHLALAPETEAPELLWEHHQVVADSVSLAPREGSTAIRDIMAKPLATISREGYMYQCFTTLSQTEHWTETYCPNISGGYDACGTGVTEGTQYVTTGSALENFLGACTPGMQLTFRVERELSAGVWSYVTQYTISNHHYIEYESDDTWLMKNYRSKLTPANSTTDYWWGAGRD